MDTNQKRQRERRLQDKRRDKEMKKRERAEQKRIEPQPGPAASAAPAAPVAPAKPAAPIPPPPHIAAQRGEYTGRIAPSRAPKPGGVSSAPTSRTPETRP